MKKNFFFFTIFALFSCQSNNYKENIKAINLLLDSNVTIYHFYSETNQQQMPWITHFKLRPFITSLFNKVLQNKVILYDPIYEDTVFKILDKNTLLYILKNNKKLLFDSSQFNEILFYESWYLDTNKTFDLQKKLIYWSPVKRENETLKLAGKIKCNNYNNLVTLAKQIIYEFPLNDTLFQNERLNKKKLVKILLDWAKNNPTNTYNPFSAQKYTKEELYKKLNISDSLTYLPYNDINSLLFIENWYYDPTSFSISKEVLSVAPVVYIYDSAEISKQILFVINIKNNPIIIF